jgi:hypothetical protein
MAEEMIGAGLHTVIVDPVGVWWGLRSSADGNASGLPIAILGGDHGDAPIEPTAGKLVADLVIDERISAVLDLSNFKQGEMVRFMSDFAEALYHRNRKPLHVILDEADAFAPQSPMPDERRMLGAIERIVRRGRARGLGVTLITQRPAVLNKNVLTQIEVLVTLRMSGPQDRKAIEAWISAYGTEAQGKELISSLADLPIGEAWFWSPAWLGVFQRVKVRTRRTFDSSATPKVGKTYIQPKKFAEVDLGLLTSKMTELIEKAKQEDPAELRRRIADLEKQLRVKPPVEVREVQVPVVSEQDMAKILEAAAIIERAASALASRPQVPGPTTTRPLPIERAPVPARAPSLPVEGVSNPQQRILDALAEFADLGLTSVSKSNIAVFADQSPRSSGYTNNLGTLRTALGLISYPQPGFVALTDAGKEAARSSQSIRSIDDLHQAWYAKLPRPKVSILMCLVECYPESIGKGELAERAGQSPTSSGYTNNLGSLRSLGLIDYPAPGYVAATDLLFPDGLH